MVKFSWMSPVLWMMVGSEELYVLPTPRTRGQLVPRSSPPSSPWMVGDLLHNRGMAEQKTHTLTIMCSPTSFCQRGADINNLDPITPA